MHSVRDRELLEQHRSEELQRMREQLDHIRWGLDKRKRLQVQCRVHRRRRRGVLSV